MTIAVTVALLIYLALLYRGRLDDDRVGRGVLVFAISAQAAIGVAQLTALNEIAFTIVLMPAVGLAALGLLISRYRAAQSS